MTLEDDMLELMSLKHGKKNAKRFCKKSITMAVLNLGAFNHPQALKGLKEGMRMSRPWYNLRALAINIYSIAYEQVKRYIPIEVGKAARVRDEQLEEIKK